MNAPLRHPQEAVSAVSQSWFALARHTDRGFQPFLCGDELAVIPDYDLARAVANAYDAYVVPMGMSVLPPNLARYHEVMTIPDSRSVPESFDIEAMDYVKALDKHQRAQGVGYGSAWGR